MIVTGRSVAWVRMVPRAWVRPAGRRNRLVGLTSWQGSDLALGDIRRRAQPRHQLNHAPDRGKHPLLQVVCDADRLAVAPSQHDDRV
jgi:hypothetical protein